MKLTSIIVCFLLAGCASSSLTSGGRGVRETNAQLSGVCTFVGNVDQRGMFLLQSTSLNQAKNMAADLGANWVQRTGFSWDEFIGDAYKCPETMTIRNGIFINQDINVRAGN